MPLRDPELDHLAQLARCRTIRVKLLEDVEFLIGQVPVVARVDPLPDHCDAITTTLAMAAIRFGPMPEE
jgi:hypothetical protein